MQSKAGRSYSDISIFITFLGLIIIGTGLLLLPVVHFDGPITLLDRLFMATSAVCVTGLVTVPTSGFNLPGQLVLLTLMQLGAIGIMTITTSLILVLRGELSLSQRLQAASINEGYALREVEGVLITVVKFTFFTEAAGWVLLTGGFLLEGFGVQASLYYALFHTVSAFCNAGFSPFDTSLVGMNSLITATVMGLIILGGVGYYVVFDLLNHLRASTRMSIHTRVVLLGSLLLIAGGAVLLILLQRGELSILDGVFQSVTARTAGFNTVDLEGLRTGSRFLLILLMIIGAAPGSTGGGVKLTTFAVTFLTVYHVLRGRDRIVVFGRKLPQATIMRAHALLFLYLGFLVLGTGLLLQTEKENFLTTFFEMTSAVGTVGLSLGLTGQLTAAGKWIILLGMFIGRIGPAVLVLTFLRGERASRVDYPEEKIILG